MNRELCLDINHLPWWKQLRASIFNQSVSVDRFPRCQLTGCILDSRMEQYLPHSKSCISSPPHVLIFARLKLKLEMFTYL